MRRLSVLSFALGVILLAVMAYQASQNGLHVLPLLIGGIAAMLAARIEDIAKFKFSLSGIEAEMRSVIDEAKVSVEQLQRLAVTQARVTVQQIASSGRVGGGGSKRREFELTAEVVTALKSLGVPDTDIKAVTDVERPYVLFDYVNWILASIPEVLIEKDVGAWTEFYSSNLSRPFDDPTTPDELEHFIRAKELGTDEVFQRLLDYRHYWSNGTHRRPDTWFAHDGN